MPPELYLPPPDASCALAPAAGAPYVTFYEWLCWLCSEAVRV